MGVKSCWRRPLAPRGDSPSRFFFFCFLLVVEGVLPAHPRHSWHFPGGAHSQLDTQNKSGVFFTKRCIPACQVIYTQTDGKQEEAAAEEGDGGIKRRRGGERKRDGRRKRGGGGGAAHFQKKRKKNKKTKTTDALIFIQSRNTESNTRSKCLVY